MSGMEPAVIAAMAPEMLGATAAAAAPEIAATAIAPELAAAAMPTLAETAAPAMFSNPGLTGLMQNMGLYGNVIDATGGLETAATAANNVGGGLLGKAGMAKMFTPEAMMMNGMKMAGQGLLGGQQQPMPHAMPSMQTGGDYRSLVPQSGSDYRKRRDELLKRMLGMQ